MERRPLGSTGISLPVLGLGAMRLPVIDGDNARIDEDAALRLVRTAVDLGVDYIDTAYPYHGPGWPRAGASEPFIGRALRDGYRDRVTLATKLTPATVEKADDLERMLESQLERLCTDHIDCYLLHSLDAAAFKKLVGLGALDLLERALDDGRIRNAGFSFHDSYPVFEHIVDAWRWDFCQIQLNYMDVGFQAGLAGLRHAHGRGLGTIVMEPLKGGRLARRPPADVQAVWDATGIDRSPAEWALRWLWSMPEVTCVLSGMTTLEQLHENVAAATRPDFDVFTEAEHDAVRRAREAFADRTVADCTACGYCKPCPSGIDIPTFLKMLNNASMYDDRDGVKRFYDTHDSARASECTACRVCEGRCPQGLPVARLMERVAETFED